MLWFLFVVAMLSAPSAQFFPGTVPDEADYRHLYPIVHVGVRVYEKFSSHTLSYFLGSLEMWRYPKDRMHVSFFVDSSAEEMASALNRWSGELSTKFFLSSTVRDVDHDNWREISLTEARRRRSAFSLITDTNCFFLPDSLRYLVELLHDAERNNSAVMAAAISPLLNAPYGSYSNLHDLMGEDFVLRRKLGTQRVYYANGPLLLYLRHKDSSYLTFNEENLRTYHGRGTPIDVLAFSAFSMNISIVVDNTRFYGYFFHAGDRSTPLQHRRIFNTFLANLMSDVGPASLMHSIVVLPQFSEPTKFGFDAVFLINLARRPERLRKMTAILDVLGIDFEVVSAVDGSQLTETQMSQIKFLPGYKDPFYHRPMKRGEIGCFLSHLSIWRRMITEDLDKVIIFEDDVRFTANGLEILTGTIEDLMKNRLDWELIYLGRKKISDDEEFFVPGHRYLSTVSYSYWTLGYAITKKGAQKLLDAQPLQKLMALDEFLPILYGRHPNKQWTEVFAMPEHAILKAFTTQPPVIEPQRYTNQPGYVSDTEDSAVVDNVTAAIQGGELPSSIPDTFSSIYSEGKLEL